MIKYICMCEDSNGVPHNKETSKEEYDQDGMCSRCAEHVWNELIAEKEKEYKWYHEFLCVDRYRLD